MASARKGAYSPKNHWAHVANWPMAYRETRLYATPDLGLTKKAPTGEGAKITYRFDPAHPVQTYGGANLTFDRGPQDQRQVGQRPDYFRFQTPVLDKDVTIAGPVTVEVYGATDGPDTDFEAKLVDVYPDGYEALVLDAPIRARYRGGRMPDDVRMMTPNAPEKMVIDMWNTALTFEKGHRIALHITSSNAPRFLVNHNNGDNADNPKPPRVAVNSCRSSIWTGSRENGLLSPSKGERLGVGVSARVLWKGAGGASSSLCLRAVHSPPTRTLPPSRGKGGALWTATATRPRTGPWV
jgi:putative CocE/NonD family hydrolase